MTFHETIAAMHAEVCSIFPGRPVSITVSALASTAAPPILSHSAVVQFGGAWECVSAGAGTVDAMLAEARAFRPPDSPATMRHHAARLIAKADALEAAQ